MVPIISNEQCQQYYRLHVKITDKHICTLDRSGKKSCGIGDSGGPLVVYGQLVGVLSGSGERDNQYNPDIFMRLSHPDYKNWIISNTPHNLYNPRNSLQERFEDIHKRRWFGEHLNETFHSK